MNSTVDIQAPTPRFTHDCERCRFLGDYEEYDLYVCARDGKIDTVIARYGSDGPEYMSGVIFAVLDPIKDRSPPLVESLKRATALGLVPRRGTQ